MPDSGGCSKKRLAGGSILRHKSLQSVIFLHRRKNSVASTFANHFHHIRGNIHRTGIFHDSFSNHTAAVRNRTVITVHAHHPFVRSQGIDILQMSGDSHIFFIAVQFNNPAPSVGILHLAHDGKGRIRRGIIRENILHPPFQGNGIGSCIGSEFLIHVQYKKIKRSKLSIFRIDGNIENCLTVLFKHIFK